VGGFKRMRGHNRKTVIVKGRGESKEKKRETYARVLDYLPYGHPDDTRPVYQKKPLVQALGEDNFILMELSPKKDKIPSVYDKVYIGEGEREEIDHVIRRLRYNELTPTAKVELPYILEIVVKEHEERFIQTFNEAKPITTRLHTLDLFPGIGKKLMWAILEERKKGSFSDFETLTKRVKGLHHPEKIIAKRIGEEIMNEHIKYKIFIGV
jgi:putative nucleotide binding protein